MKRERASRRPGMFADRRFVVARAAIALALVSFEGTARAHCRTTTCKDAECKVDPSCEVCLTGGKPLWRPGCTSLAPQTAGSKIRPIHATPTRAALARS